LISLPPESTVLRCANPACRRPLSSPREGQVLEFEVVSVSIAASDDEPQPWDESPKREAARVYICSECAQTGSVTIGPDGISILPASSQPK
jgi:hypothetical protein